MPNTQKEVRLTLEDAMNIEQTLRDWDGNDEPVMPKCPFYRRLKRAIRSASKEKNK